MPAEHQIILWGVAACTPVVLSFAFKRLLALGVATLLLMGWVLARVISVFWGPPESMVLYPLLDALFGAITFAAWKRRAEPWLIVLTGLFLFQCVLHAAFWLAYPAPRSLYVYVVANNAIFALELLTAGWGASRDVARAFLDGLLGRPGGVHHARTRPP